MFVKLGKNIERSNNTPTPAAIIVNVDGDQALRRQTKYMGIRIMAEVWKKYATRTKARNLKKSVFLGEKRYFVAMRMMPVATNWRMPFIVMKYVPVVK